MNYKYLDMNTYKRKNHFEYFKNLSFPYVGTTVNVDITDLLKLVKSKKLPFFLTFCYCASRAANSIAEFRQRIDNDNIIEFTLCRTSHTVAMDDETYCYCTLSSDRSFEEFIDYGIREQDKAKLMNSIEEKASDILDKIFVSSLPWITYTSLIQPVPAPADSNPRITWGKYYLDGNRTLLPVSLLCHHALIDGIHIAKFYKLLESEMETLVEICNRSA